MSIYTPDSNKNNFIKIPNHLKDTIKLNGIIVSDEKLEKIETKFKEQFPEIDEKSYKLLKRENKKIGRNYEEINKNNVDYYELINFSFFNSILKEISKENKNISDVKIYNTYGYTDRKTGVDYTVFLKLTNGANIAFGIDLKNGKNSEENFNEIITGIFTLITQDKSGKTLNYEGIKKNIEISKNLYNNPTKQKRKYTIGINYKNQSAINQIVMSDILTTNLNYNLSNLNIFDHIKKYLIEIINNEINAYNKGIIGNIAHTRDSAQELLEKGKELEIQAKLIKEEEKEKEKEKKIKTENKKTHLKIPKKRKYETGKNYTPTNLINDIKEILEWNKNNISQQINKIAKNLNIHPKAKKKFINIYNTLKKDKKRGNKQFYKIKIETKKITEIKYISKIQKNRLEKIYEQLLK